MTIYKDELKFPSGHIVYYHYSLEPYTVLLSKNAQAGKPLKRMLAVTDDKAMDYDDNISLFIEPIPLDIIGKLWPNHHFWKSGKEIYQHVIMLDGIPDRLIYDMVETPEFGEWYDNHKGEFDKAFRKRTDEYLIAKKIIGTNKEDMVHCTERYLGTTRQAYLRSAKNNPDTKRYASDVPHLMTFVLGGAIQVQSVSKVKIK